MTRIVRKDPKKPDDDPDDNDPDAEITVPHAMLAGEHVLVGGLDAPALHVVTATGVTKIDTAQIHRLERDDSADNPALASFAVELMQGGTLTGPLEERLLAIRAGDHVLRVPVEHLVSFVSPKPEPKEKPKPAEKPKEPKKPALTPKRPGPAPAVARHSHPTAPATVAPAVPTRPTTQLQRLEAELAQLKRIEAQFRQGGVANEMVKRVKERIARVSAEIAAAKKRGATPPRP